MTRRLRACPLGAKLLILQRALHIALALYLVLGLTGATAALAEIAGAHVDCCSDCEDPGCPDDGAESCPPQCDDCVCPSWMAPITTADSTAITGPRAPSTLSYTLAEITRDPPPPRGVFRPPRAAV